MWKYDKNDPNDPNNPFGNNYQPRYVYELHVTHQGRPVGLKPAAVQTQSSKNNLKMVTPYVELDNIVADIPFASANYISKRKFYLITGNIKLKFTGQIKAQYPVLKNIFERLKPSYALQFQSSGNTVFNNINTQWTIDPTNLNESSVTATINNSSYNSTNVSVTGGIPSIDVATNNGDTGNSGVTFSPVTPTALTFHYDTEEFNAKSGTSIIKGQLHLEMGITVTPLNQENAAPLANFSQAWNTVKTKVENLTLSGAGFTTGNTGLILIMRPANIIPIFNEIIANMIQALENQDTDNNSMDTTALAMSASFPEVLPP